MASKLSRESVKELAAGLAINKTLQSLELNVTECLFDVLLKLIVE